MTIRELIDFYLAIRSPGNLLGFDAVFSRDLEELKQAIQAYYGDRETWLDLPENTELPEDIARKARDLMDKHDAWKGENGKVPD